MCVCVICSNERHHIGNNIINSAHLFTCGYARSQNHFANVHHSSSILFLIKVIKNDGNHPANIKSELEKKVFDAKVDLNLVGLSTGQKQTKR